MAGVAITALADPDPASLAAAGRLAPNAARCRDADELLARDDVDAVLVTAPSGLHAELGSVSPRPVVISTSRSRWQRASPTESGSSPRREPPESSPRSDSTGGSIRRFDAHAPSSGQAGSDGSATFAPRSRIQGRACPPGSSRGPRAAALSSISRRITSISSGSCSTPRSRTWPRPSAPAGASTTERPSGWVCPTERRRRSRSASGRPRRTSSSSWARSGRSGSTGTEVP